VYGLEGAYWNDLRLTAVDTTTNAHKVKDGRKVVDGATFSAGAFVTGSTYLIRSIGNTDFTALGAQTNNLGQIFTATGTGSFIAGSFVVGKQYTITAVGTTNFTLIGAASNTVGVIFTATGVGSGNGTAVQGTGTAQIEDWKDENFVVDGKSLVELRVYAGSTAAVDQIYPPQSSSNTQAAYWNIIACFT